ncbi:unnamed protein product [Mytilus edulis]|uniref:Uncharacterized protein n=1 Tax=Mytilus edulis TaxID=6550 RepID=A0A8S3V5Z8_MYTED|nr:unnamed protein product [Mytilus edulis]
MIYTILLLSIVCCCQATTYTFGKNCSVDLERIHDHADIFVMYDGEQLHETCNDMSFSGFDEDNPDDLRLRLITATLNPILDNSFVAAVVGGVIGGFVFICIVTGVIIFMTCKRKRSPGQVLTPVYHSVTDHSMKLRITTIIYLLNVIVAVCGTSVQIYTFGEDCSVYFEMVNEDESIIAEYYGKKDLGSWCDYMSFTGRDSGYRNEYKICITPLVYEDPDCAVELTYRERYSGSPLKTYTCNDKPTTKYCGEQDEYMYIYLTSKRTNNFQNVQVKLKIEAVMTYDYSITIGIIIGCVIGGIVLISVIVGVILCYTCKRRTSAGQVMNPGTEMTMAQYQSPNESYPSQPTGNYAPPPGSYPTQPTGNYPVNQLVIRHNKPEMILLIPHLRLDLLASHAIRLHQPTQMFQKRRSIQTYTCIQNGDHEIYSAFLLMKCFYISCV